MKANFECERWSHGTKRGLKVVTENPILGLLIVELQVYTDDIARVCTSIENYGHS